MLRSLRLFGSLLGRLAFRCGIRSHVTLENLERAFPEWNRAAARRMAARSYGNLGIVFFEFLYLRFASRRKVERGLEIENLEDVRTRIFGKNGSILLSGHIGNWEWLALGCALRIAAPIEVIIKNQRSSVAERFLLRMRTRFGNRMLNAGNVRAIYRALRTGGRIAILGDQTASAEDVRVPFFGRLVPTFEGTARLALATRAPILFLQPYERTAYGYRARFIEVPFDELAEVSPDNIRELTARHTRVLEAAVREHPEFWLWQHRRWKHAKE